MHYDQYHYTVLQTARVIVAAVEGFDVTAIHLRVRTAAERPRFASDAEIRFYTNNPDALEKNRSRDEIADMVRKYGISEVDAAGAYWSLKQDILDAVGEIFNELPGGE